jgi:hypothetical protein
VDLDSLTLGWQRTAVEAGDGAVTRRNLASMAAGSGAPPAKVRAPVRKSIFGDPSVAVDLAWVAAHWHAAS